MKFLRKPVLALCVISQVGLAACASKSENISAAYVSPIEYQDYSCRQVRGEMRRLSRRVSEISGVQDAQATKDSVALGVGLIVFWPALFFMIGKDKGEELSRLKGEYEALEQTAIQKDCDVAKEIEAAKELEAKRIEERNAQGVKEKGQLND